MTVIYSRVFTDSLKTQKVSSWSHHEQFVRFLKLFWRIEGV